ncbi:MAG: hypothetical protein LBV43_06410 [Prevotella sp.]|jgi:hypothetical protein|nr:hypothetical protein [Prevotella sp.]
MKGFILQVNDKSIAGAIDSGSTSINIVCREDQCQLSFSSLNKDGMLAYTWCTSDLTIGDSIIVCFDDIDNLSEAQRVLDYNNSHQINALSLETYYKLKKELEEEGLL